MSGVVACGGVPGIAIVGMSGRFPGAPDLATFWRNLAAGVESIATFDDGDLAESGVDPSLAADGRWVRAGGALDGVELFDAAFFGFSPREAELLDPQQRLFLEHAWSALEEAGYESARTRGRVGVFAGAGFGSYLIDHVLPHRELLALVGAYQAGVANDKDFLATRVSYKLDLRGPSLSVQTACSTSLVAVCLACQSLTTGDCDLALAGGVTLHLPQRGGYLFQEDGILSPDGHCRAFDAGARGTVPGNGLGVVVLKRLEDALAGGDTVRAVIRGWAVNNDGGEKAGFTAPRPEGQAEVIADALALAGFEPATVGYVEAHGTGTRLGDPIEVAALRRAFAGAPERGCALGSVKTNLGHLDAAAGVAGLIKTVLALERGQIPPTLHFTRPNPEIDFNGGPFFVADRLLDWPAGERPRRAGVSSFGIGGTNAHVVLEEAPRVAPHETMAPTGPDQTDEPVLLLLSARSEAALDVATENLARHVAEHPELDPTDVAYTLQVGRRAFEHRRALVARGGGDAAGAFRARDAARVWSARAAPGHRSVAFLFPGQGAQHPGMAARAYRSCPVFRSELDRSIELLRPHLDPLAPSLDLRALLLEQSPEGAPEAADRLRQTALAQPALFAVEYALARQWVSWGVAPEALLGHSVGEWVAACLAEVFTLEEALALVAARGRLLQALPPGAMLSLPLGEDDARRWLGEEPELALAAVNAPTQVTVAGPEPAIERLAVRLETRGIASRRLHTSHAFHSSMVEPAVEPFRELVARAAPRPPRLPFLSNLTGGWITPDEATDAGYWARHLRATVRFAPAVAELLAEPGRVLLEVGPGDALSSLTRRQPAARGQTVVASLPHPRDGAAAEAALLAAAGHLWLGGVEVDWEALHRGERRRRVPLPTYPFERQRYWLEARPGGAVAAGGETTAGPPVKRQEPAEWFYLPSWTRAPRAAARGTGQTWLVVEDAFGLGARLTARLAASGEEVVRAVAGDRFERPASEGAPYRLRPDETADVEALAADLGERGKLPRGVAFLWGLAPRASGATGDHRPAGFAAAGLLALVHAFGRRPTDHPVYLTFVANGLYEVLGGETFAPEQAAAAGLAKVVAQEHPHLRCRTVDIAWDGGGETLEDLAERLAAEIASSAAEPVVALRGRHRWRQGFEPVRLGPAAARESPLRDGARVLVTGGLGSLGLMLAEQLAPRGVRLALLDRQRPQQAGPAVRARLASLAAAGAEVEILAADVADAAALGGVLRPLVERWGGLDVMVHAAGAPATAYKTLAEVGADDLREHLAPKRGGAAALDAVLRQLAGAGLTAPPLCLATSSLAPVLGGIGLAAFAAADAALDAFCQAAATSGDGAPHWLAVGWEGWGAPWEGEAGTALPGLAQQEALMLTAGEVTDALDRLLTGAPALGAVTHVVVATADLAPRLAQWTDLTGTARPMAFTTHPRRDAGAAFHAPEGQVEERIAALWQEVLGVDRIGRDDDFFAFGGNSLAGLQILSRLRGEFAVELPLQTFFEARTIAAMAVAIEAERSKGAADEERLAALLADVESLSDEEVAALLADELAPAKPAAADLSISSGDSAPLPPATTLASAPGSGAAPIQLSLFFFSADGSTDAPHKYAPLLSWARFADREGFVAVWTPERHFQEFGGLFPNPSVLGAALAMATERLQIRAGSVALPLHHPLRVAEEWSVVDNLSGGRAAISCAAGWHPSDFVLRPENYEARKEVMLRSLETIRRLWAGETLRLPGGGGQEFEAKLLPRPLQRELPVWVTSSGSTATWVAAGEVGANVLSAMGSQPFEDLADKIARYREARRRAGHAGPGVVTVMLHTFLGDDLGAVREVVRAPLSDYLRTHLRQRDSFLDIPGISEDDKEALIPLAFDHYLRSSSLIGTAETCSAMLDRLAAIGVDEAACLVDFGVPSALIEGSLERLAALRRAREAAQDTAPRPAGPPPAAAASLVAAAAAPEAWR